MKEKIKKSDAMCYKNLEKMGFKLFELIKTIDVKSEDALVIKLIKTLSLFCLFFILFFLGFIVFGVYCLISLISIFKEKFEL